MRRAGRGARWRPGGKCRGGEGRRRRSGGCGCRREPPRCTVVTTDMGEQGEQQKRRGDHRLPTCRVREGADRYRKRHARCGGQAALQRGAKSSADRTDARPSSTEVRRNACQRETAWGTEGGTRRAGRSATQRVCKSAGQRRSVLATRCATMDAFAASVVDRPPTQRVVGYTMVQISACEHTVTATGRRRFRLQMAASGRVLGENRRVQVAVCGCEARSVRPQVREGEASCARAEAGVRQVRAGAAQQRGAGGAPVCQSGTRCSAGEGG